MMTVVKIVLLMDHSLVKGISLDKIFLIIPVHLLPIVLPLCQVENGIDQIVFQIAEVASHRIQKGNLEKAFL